MFDVEAMKAALENAKRAAEAGVIPESEQLEALIGSMRQSAQDTLAALRRRGFRIAKEQDGAA